MSLVIVLLGVGVGTVEVVSLLGVVAAFDLFEAIDQQAIETAAIDASVRNLLAIMILRIALCTFLLHMMPGAVGEFEKLFADLVQLLLIHFFEIKH